MTLDEAKNLKKGDMIYWPIDHYYADGKSAQSKVTLVKTWKKSPDRVEIHTKFGLYQYDTFNEMYLSLLMKVPECARRY